ncbi:MAG: pyruvate kinase [Treponema sp.]|nr:MAG: pyruvate kinase [Treponema sp.]
MKILQKTKIVCTIGPASDNEEVLRRMFKAGLNVCRLNFSHGSLEDHAKKIALIKRLRKEMELPIAIMTDLQGPKIRVGKFKNGFEHIQQKQEFIFTTRDVEGTSDICSVSYANLVKDVSPGKRILVNDGLLEFTVVDVLNDTDVKCVAVNDGVISNNKGVNIPGVYMNVPFLSEKDIRDIDFAIEMGVDFIAASFTQRAEDLLQIKEIIKSKNAMTGIIAKIENQEGLNNSSDIIKVSDGIMVARGDMGVEIEPALVAFAQKELIRNAGLVGKPVITATQMLESMTHSRRPTRAEVTDVTNAILDGTSAVMLSGETAAGEFPVEAVQMMHRIAVTTENTLDYEKLAKHSSESQELTITNAIARATCSIATELKASAIITASTSGFTSRSVSKFKPKASILALTDQEWVTRRLALAWGVYPILSPTFKTTDSMFEICTKVAKEHRFVKEGETVVLTAGVPIGKAGSTNLIKVKVVQ